VARGRRCRHAQLRRLPGGQAARAAFDTQFPGDLLYLGAIPAQLLGFTWLCSILPASRHGASAWHCRTLRADLPCTRGTEIWGVSWHTHSQPGLGSRGEFKPFHRLKRRALGCPPANALCALLGMWVRLPAPAPGCAAGTGVRAGEAARQDRCQGASRAARTAHAAHAAHAARGVARQRGERSPARGVSGSGDWDGARGALARADVLVLSKT